MSAWVLIIMLNWGYKYGAAVDHVPFATEEACQQVARHIMAADAFRKWAFCAPTGAK